MAGRFGGIDAGLGATAAADCGSSMTLKSRRRRVLRVGMLGLGAVTALTTTGCPGYYYTAQAYFANTTRESVTVRLLELEANVNCTRLSGRAAEALAHRELFGRGQTYEVAPGEALPLSLRDEARGSGSEGCAVLLQMLGQPDRVVAWPAAPSVETESTLAPVKDRVFREVSLRLEGAGAVQGVAIGDALEVTALPPATSAVALPSAPARSLGWSGLASSRPGVKLWRSEVLPDGCLSLELGESQSSVTRLYLCVPNWAFPFELDQVLDVRIEALENSPSAYGQRSNQARHLTIASVSPRRRLELWLNASSKLTPSIRAESSAGAGYRTLCGGYADPLTVVLAPDVTRLTVGAIAERQTTGYRRRALLGRADEMLVAPAACEDDYGALGARFDLLTLEEWEDTP